MDAFTGYPRCEDPESDSMCRNAEESSSRVISPGKQYHSPLQHQIPPLESASTRTSCFRCHRSLLLRSKTHCHNCGHLCCAYCAVHTDALPHFGYFDPVSVCGYCRQFLPFRTMDRATLLSQTANDLRQFVKAYDLTTINQGVVEVMPMPVLVDTILRSLPLTDANERYFRANIPSFPSTSWLSHLPPPPLPPIHPLEQINCSIPPIYGSSEGRDPPLCPEDPHDFERALVQMYGFDMEPEELDRLENRLDPRPTPSVGALIADGVDLHTLQARILRNILRDNYVPFLPGSGKAALVASVQRLRRNTAREIAAFGSVSQEREDAETQCRICCDAPSICLFLECAHLIACLPCAQRLELDKSPCPICRQPISRIIHVFRS